MMTNIDINVTHSLQECENNCIDLLHSTIENLKKFRGLSLEFAKSILEYCMIVLNIPRLSLVLDEKFENGEGCSIGSKIILNSKSLKLKKPTDIANLMDTLIHESKHINIHSNNKDILKDENGNLNGEYLPPFHDKPALIFLNKFMPYIDRYSLVLGLYAKDRNEKLARETAKVTLLKLIDKYEKRYHTNHRALEEIKKRAETSYANSQFNEYIDYLCIYKDKIIRCADEYQTNFALDPKNDSESKILLKVARSLHVNHEADSNLLYKYIARGEIDNAITLLNSPLFKNTTDDIELVLESLNGNERDIRIALERFNDDVVDKYLNKYVYSIQ